MFLGQHRKGLPEFIQQDGRIDACGSDALTSVAGGYQGATRLVSCIGNRFNSRCNAS
jgi:hypothetical protein